MHTPEQAHGLWCPMVKLAREQAIAIDGHDRHNCVADKCAMWCWKPGEGTHTERRSQQGTVALVGGGTEVRWSEYDAVVPNAPTHGFCGLAGRPV